MHMACSRQSIGMANKNAHTICDARRPYQMIQSILKLEFWQISYAYESLRVDIADLAIFMVIKR